MLRRSFNRLRYGEHFIYISKCSFANVTRDAKHCGAASYVIGSLAKGCSRLPLPVNKLPYMKCYSAAVPALLPASIIVAALFLASAGFAFAHSTVEPAQTETSKYETFTLNVPTERDVPTTGIRLVVPPELDRVTPFVKPDWRISVTKDADGNVTEIAWTGGSIPAGQKDVFEFTARTPEEGATLIWKAYQTYQGGEVVAWDRDPQELQEGEERVPNPYSSTEVAAPEAPVSEDKESSMPAAVAWGALALSIISLALSVRRTRS